MTPTMQKTGAEDPELHQLEQDIAAFLATGDSTAIERRLTTLCKELLPRLQKAQDSSSRGLRSSGREQAAHVQQVFFRLAVILGRLLDRWTRPGASDDLRRLANDVIELHDDVIELAHAAPAGAVPHPDIAGTERQGGGRERRGRDT